MVCVLSVFAVRVVRACVYVCVRAYLRVYLHVCVFVFVCAFCAHLFCAYQ